MRIVRIKSIDGLDDVVLRNTLAAFASAGLSDGGLRHGLLFLAVRHGVRSERKFILWAGNGMESVIRRR